MNSGCKGARRIHTSPPPACRWPGPGTTSQTLGHWATFRGGAKLGQTAGGGAINSPGVFGIKKGDKSSRPGGHFQRGGRFRQTGEEANDSGRGQRHGGKGIGNDSLMLPGENEGKSYRTQKNQTPPLRPHWEDRAAGADQWFTNCFSYSRARVSSSYPVAGSGT